MSASSTLESSNSFIKSHASLYMRYLFETSLGQKLAICANICTISAIFSSCHLLHAAQADIVSIFVVST